MNAVPAALALCIVTVALVACDASGDMRCVTTMSLSFIDSEGADVAGVSGTLILPSGESLAFGCGDAAGTVDPPPGVHCAAGESNRVVFDLRIPDGETVQLIAESADGTRSIDFEFPPDYRPFSHCETATRDIVLHVF